jgi:hypothetical protein
MELDFEELKETMRYNAEKVLAAVSTIALAVLIVYVLSVLK